MFFMLLNRVEKALMNNPIRALSQRWIEAPRLLAMAPLAPGARVLEVGCGRGVGAEIALDLFGAAHVDAFDLDPEMVRLARTRLEHRSAEVRFWVGDVERIDAPDGAYDAVFDFAILHHAPRWRVAVSEIARVLRPGGRLYAEEVLRDFIDAPLWRRLLDHPKEDRFDARSFADALRCAGLRGVEARDLLGQFAWFVAEKS
jgi:ubiquinone/menaquinone biosynthesis C-methylase UbiE